MLDNVPRLVGWGRSKNRASFVEYVTEFFVSDDVDDGFSSLVCCIVDVLELGSFRIKSCLT